MALNKNGFAISLLLTAMAVVTASASPLFKVLLINQCGSGGYVHAAISTTSTLLQTLATQKGFTLVTPATAAETQAKMNDDSLATYQIILLNNTSRIGGVISSAPQQAAFQKWLKHGGGLVAWHGAMDHGDVWPWIRDSVFSGTRFNVASTDGSNAGKTAQVQLDTVRTNGIVPAQKYEYADLRAALPSSHWTWPDEWFSFTVNPRNSMDVLLSIDESTYDVPTGGFMGANHPVAWAYTLPADSSGRHGRFIFSARGHDAGAYTGTGFNAAPNGIDTGASGLTMNFIWQGMRWAAGLTQNPIAVAYSGGPFSYTVSIPVSLTAITVGNPTSCVSSPALPAGLSIDSTCKISGTPTSMSPATAYTITASAGNASSQTQITLSVAPKMPANFSYQTLHGIYGIAVPIIPDTAQITGVAPVKFSLTSPLPTGLALDTLTGILSGTPSLAQVETSYVVTATNTFGSAQDTIWIAIRNPISSFGYAKKILVLGRNIAMTPDTPSSTGTAPYIPIKYRVTPPLAPGLLLDSNTGVVSGATGVAQPSTKYSIVAANGVAQFNRTDSLQITVLAAPTAFSYSRNPVAFGMNAGNIIDTPLVTGTVTSYSSDTALPSGLHLDTTTGVISGTPASASSPRNYTLTARNIAGSTNLQLNLAVAAAPSVLIYPYNPVVFVRDSAATPDTPSVNGSFLTYSVTPALPSGMALDSIRGVLSGTPTTVSAAKGYTVTATNVAGSTNATVNITVRAPVVAIALNGKKSIIVQIAGGALTFHLPDEAKSAELTVMTIWGRVVWKQTFDGLDDGNPDNLTWDDASVQTNALSSGIYVAHLKFMDSRGKSVGSLQKRFSLVPSH